MEQAEPSIAILLAALEALPARRWSEADLIGMGFDPSAARRRFRRHFGMTFWALPAGGDCRWAFVRCRLRLSVLRLSRVRALPRLRHFELRLRNCWAGSLAVCPRIPRSRHTILTRRLARCWQWLTTQRYICLNLLTVVPCQTNWRGCSCKQAVRWALGAVR